MSYPIVQNFIPGLPKNPYRHGVGAYEGVVDHSTATPEASDEAERNYEAAHWNDAFVQFFVDWDSITQVADIDYTAWGAGPNANPRFVHIELCETSDPVKFKASYDRYVWLSAWILSRKNLGVTDGVTLWSHAEVTQNLGGTTHTDPVAYLGSHGVTWAQHVANVKAMYDSFFSGSVAQPHPVAAPGQQYGAQPVSTGNPIVAKVEVIVDGLNCRQHPDPNSPILFVTQKGQQYNVTANINDWHEVIIDNNGHNGYLFGNNGQYLSLVHDQAPAAVQPVSTGIKAVGNIKIVGVRVAAFICDAPSQNSNNLSTATLGTVLPISGSVPGWWEVIWNGRRAYVNAKYGVRV